MKYMQLKPLKDHIEDKLQRCLGVFPRLENVHIILDHEARMHMAEVVVQASGHIRLCKRKIGKFI